MGRILYASGGLEIILGGRSPAKIALYFPRPA